MPKSLLTFKLLVFDTATQELIAPVMKVGSIRECNIALHLNLKTERQRIPDIPVVYMVEPTEANVKQIVIDS